MFRDKAAFLLYKYTVFFKQAPFLKGKVPFIFNQTQFIIGCGPTLQSSVTTIFDPLKLTELARKTGFQQRKSKLKPAEFIDTMMFCDLDHSRLSLQDCCNDLASQHQKSISKVALHKRFNDKSFNFLKSVLSEQMASKLGLNMEKHWQTFTRVLIADSCKFTLPDQYQEHYPGFAGTRSKSLMNIQYAFDLKQGDWQTLELTKATENDLGYSKRVPPHIVKGDLHIRDLGYVSHNYLKKVVAEEAFFLNRLHPLWKPTLRNTDKSINWPAFYQKVRDRKSGCEVMITIGKGKDAFDCRLVALPVPEQVWVERIRKAQAKAKSVGYELTDEYKHRCRLSLFITNVPKETLKTEDIIQLYRLRWQIELVFKTWKSLLDLHKVKVVKKDRMECQLLGRFIWILLNWKIFRCVDAVVRKNSFEYACSLWKFFKQARQCSHLLRLVIKGKIRFNDWYEIAIFNIVKNWLIEPKKGKKSGYQIINEIFVPLS